MTAFARRLLALGVGIGAAAVVAVGAVVVIDQPFGSYGKLDASRCTTADLRVTAGGLNVQAVPAIDSVFLSIQTRRHCALAGPLRLQAEGRTGSWATLGQAPAAVRNLSPHHLGNVGPQASGSLPLDTATTYDVDIAWKRTSSHCRTPGLRLAGPGVSLPLDRLPQWCGQPIAVSNTFAGSVTYSVRWLSATATGALLTIHYRQVCHGATPQVTETATKVTIALVTTSFVSFGSCLPLVLDPIVMHVGLQQPLGNRTLVHAPVGRWPAIHP